MPKDALASNMVKINKRMSNKLMQLGILSSAFCCNIFIVIRPKRQHNKQSNDQQVTNR